MDTTMEHAVERAHPPRWVISHLVNPVARRVLRSDRKMGDEILLLRYTGRRSGQLYEVPVAYRRIDGRLALFTNSGWRHNFQGGRHAEVVLKGMTVPVRADLMDDPMQVAALYARLIGELGLENAERLLGIKINVNRAPSVEELADMAARSGLSVVWLELLA